MIAEARDLMGGNGLLLENHVIRHMGDIEVIHTYEGTETMQSLIVGRDITGVARSPEQENRLASQPVSFSGRMAVTHLPIREDVPTNG